MQEDRASSSGKRAGEREEEIRLGEDYELKSSDVLCGGRGTKETDHYHEGNERLKLLLTARVDRYREATNKVNKGDKSLIVSEIIEAVHDSGGRFVMQRQNMWYDVGQSKARDKISTAFRLMLGRKNSGRRSASETLSTAAVQPALPNPPSRTGDNQIRSTSADSSPPRRRSTIPQRTKRAKAPAAADLGDETEAPSKGTNEFDLAAGQQGSGFAAPVDALNTVEQSPRTNQSSSQLQQQQPLAATPQGVSTQTKRTPCPQLTAGQVSVPARTSVVAPVQVSQAGEQRPSSENILLTPMKNQQVGGEARTHPAQQVPRDVPIPVSVLRPYPVTTLTGTPDSNVLGDLGSLAAETALERVQGPSQESSRAQDETASNTNNSSPSEDPPSSNTMSSFERSVIRRTFTPPPQGGATDIPIDFSVPLQSGDHPSQGTRKSSSDESDSSFDQKLPAY